MIDQHVDDLIDAYVLGALEPDELAQVETHLSTCVRCRELAAVAHAATQQLFLGMPLVSPSASLRQRVIDRVHAERLTAAVEEAPQIASRNLFQRFVRSLLGKDITDEAATMALRFLADPNCIIWEVGGTEAAPQANARLVAVPDSREAVLVTSGLRTLDPDRTYQIWLLHDGKPRPNALFRVSRGGYGRQIVAAPTNFRDFEVVAVTPEPASGSAAPTGPIVLMGSLSA